MNDNIDVRTVAGFGDEWTRFDQSQLAEDESLELFLNYFKIFSWTELPQDAVGFDFGCGSGRWAQRVAPRVGRLHLIDASVDALDVARRKLAGAPNVVFHLASVDSIPLGDESMDFGYSLGVLHHVPDTLGGIRACVAKLKRGAPFLVYLYYSFDNRPAWFQMLWKTTDFLRRCISVCPHSIRYYLSQIIAATIYFPLARFSRVCELLGKDVSSFPLSFYRTRSFYTMRTDALDRFGTRLEQRFTKNEIENMLRAAGLEKITFSESMPFWCALGYRVR